MNFNKYVEGNKLCLHYEKVEIKELVNFLQENQSITQLSLINCKINDQGAEALAKLNSLTTLDLRYEDIGDQRAEALLKSDNFLNLKFLNFTLHGKYYSGNKVDILQEIKNSKAVIIGSICGVIAALAVGVGCGIALVLDCQYRP